MRGKQGGDQRCLHHHGRRLFKVVLTVDKCHLYVFRTAYIHRCDHLLSLRCQKARDRKGHCAGVEAETPSFLLGATRIAYTYFSKFLYPLGSHQAEGNKKKMHHPSSRHTTETKAYHSPTTCKCKYIIIDPDATVVVAAPVLAVAALLPPLLLPPSLSPLLHSPPHQPPQHPCRPSSHTCETGPTHR